MMDRSLSESDPEVADIIQAELRRQQRTLMLIPSENHTSRAVLAATGSILTNKYAEGYPGARYYNGCTYYDQIERLAIERAKELFGAEHANVQPHSGSSANMAAYRTLLEPGDRILAMSVRQGGHLTHGARVNFSGWWYECYAYGIDPATDRLNYDAISQQAGQVRPKLIVAGASAYPRSVDFSAMRQIADEVEAYLVADIAHIAGLIAADCHPDPVPHCDMVTTTTHKTLRGPRGALVLCPDQWADDIDRTVFPGLQGGPLMHVIAAKAVAFKEAAQPEFRQYQQQIIRNCRRLAQTLREHDFDLVTGGTDNHLVLVRLTSKNITGKEAADLLEAAGIVVNMNLIPDDPLPPGQTSGIRPGTPAVTTRGMKEPQMELIGNWIARVIHEGRRADGSPNEDVLGHVREQVEELCEAFPIYENL